MARLSLNLSKGFCGTTSIGGDCLAGSSGAWEIVAHGWREAASTCSLLCSECHRCRYFSVSPQWKDCSWFHSCDLANLQHEPPGFKSGRLLPVPSSGDGTAAGPSPPSVNASFLLARRSDCCRFSAYGIKYGVHLGSKQLASADAAPAVGGGATRQW